MEWIAGLLGVISPPLFFGLTYYYKKCVKFELEIEQLKKDKDVIVTFYENRIKKMDVINEELSKNVGGLNGDDVVDKLSRGEF